MPRFCNGDGRSPLAKPTITGTTITIRVIAKCEPNENLAVQREIRERVKAAFDANGVKAPVTFPPYGAGPPSRPPGL